MIRHECSGCAYCDAAAEDRQAEARGDNLSEREARAGADRAADRDERAGDARWSG